MNVVEEWRPLLRERAAAYARVALANIAREYPVDVRHLLRGPDDRLSRPRERTPVFYGSFDWHSCVEMHWLLVRLLRTVPDAVPETEVRGAVDRQLTPAGLNAEAEFIGHRDHRAWQRPYGWGWALRLVAEVETWEAADADAGRWAAALRPIANALERNFLDWLPKATYPVRYGVHSNSAFGLSLALPYASHRAGGGDTRLLDAMTEAAHRWYDDDADYPGGWEPSGSDFLSPALVEAELMACLLPTDHFAGWLARFLPGIAEQRPPALFTPAVVSDSADPYIAHLHGLNASRAWCWRRLAEALPDGDARTGPALTAMRRHAEAALPHVVGDDYMVEHWLAAYAVLLLT